jgi:hypothetical protein
MKIAIRDAQGQVYNRVENPEVIFDSETYTLIKIGERDKIKAYYDDMCRKYKRAGFFDEVSHLTYMDLPKDQDIVDKVFNITGYIQTLYKKTIVH